MWNSVCRIRYDLRRFAQLTVMIRELFRLQIGHAQSFPLVSHHWCVEHKYDSTTCLICHLFGAIDGSVTDHGRELKRPVNSPECLFDVITRSSHRCLLRY